MQVVVVRLRVDGVDDRVAEREIVRLGHEYGVDGRLAHVERLEREQSDQDDAKEDDGLGDENAEQEEPVDDGEVKDGYVAEEESGQREFAHEFVEAERLRFVDDAKVSGKVADEHDGEHFE